MLLCECAFLSPLSISCLSPFVRREKAVLSNSIPLLYRQQRPPNMMASLPDDTALDMLSFALSGPGVLAFAAFCAGGAALTFSFADFGPRRRKVHATSFLLRITLPSPTCAELPNGSAKTFRAGETVLQLHSYDACTAVARAMEQPDVSYTIYRADSGGIRSLASYPKPIDAEGGTWMRGVVQEADEGQSQARWEEYERLGTGGAIDVEWQALLDRLSLVQSSNEKKCKLCDGCGTVRCYRCGGVGTGNGAFVCDCNDGRRPCEWCCSSNS